MRRDKSQELDLRFSRRRGLRSEDEIEFRQLASVFQSASPKTRRGQGDVAAVRRENSDREGVSVLRVHDEWRRAFLPRSV